jgi:hypothetical protein
MFFIYGENNFIFKQEGVPRGWNPLVKQCFLFMKGLWDYQWGF